MNATLPKVDSWAGFGLKIVAYGGFFVTGLAFLLTAEPVQNALAKSSGAAVAQETADKALEISRSNAQTLSSLNGQILGFTQSMANAQEQIAGTTESLAGVASSIDTMTTKLLELDARNQIATVAPMSIADSGHIEDVALGARTRVTIRFSQERDCGRADYWTIRFRDGQGLSGAFEDLSVNDDEGFGPRFDVAPGSFREYTFTAVMPGDDLFVPGVAQARVVISGWTLCPEAEEARSQQIAFTILPKKK